MFNYTLVKVGLNEFKIVDFEWLVYILKYLNQQIDSQELNNNFLEVKLDLAHKDIDTNLLVNIVNLKLKNFSSQFNFSNLVKLAVLDLGDNFNHPIDNLPSSLINLILSKDFDYPLDNLPNGLEILQLSPRYNRPIDNLPESLKKLVIGTKMHGVLFNQPINNLPTNLEELYIHGEFNQPIDNLPAGLKSLSLGLKFNHPIDNLPSGLEKLDIEDLEKFNHPVDNLPKSLKLINFNKNYNSHSIDNLPDSIEEINGLRRYTIEIKKLPTNLKKIAILNKNKSFLNLLDNYKIRPELTHLSC